MPIPTKKGFFSEAHPAVLMFVTFCLSRESWAAAIQYVAHKLRADYKASEEKLEDTFEPMLYDATNTSNNAQFSSFLRKERKIVSRCHHRYAFAHPIHYQ